MGTRGPPEAHSICRLKHSVNRVPISRTGHAITMRDGSSTAEPVGQRQRTDQGDDEHRQDDRDLRGRKAKGKPVHAREDARSLGSG